MTAFINILNNTGPSRDPHCWPQGKQTRRCGFHLYNVLFLLLHCTLIMPAHIIRFFKVNFLPGMWSELNRERLSPPLLPENATSSKMMRGKQQQIIMIKTATNLEKSYILTCFCIFKHNVLTVVKRRLRFEEEMWFWEWCIAVGGTAASHSTAEEEKHLIASTFGAHYFSKSGRGVLKLKDPASKPCASVGGGQAEPLCCSPPVCCLSHHLFWVCSTSLLSPWSTPEQVPSLAQPKPLLDPGKQW